MGHIVLTNIVYICRGKKIINAIFLAMFIAFPSGLLMHTIQFVENKS